MTRFCFFYHPYLTDHLDGNWPVTFMTDHSWNVCCSLAASTETRKHISALNNAKTKLYFSNAWRKGLSWYSIPERYQNWPEHVQNQFIHLSYTGFKLNLSRMHFKSARGLLTSFFFCPQLVLTFTGLSPLDATFTFCLFIYAKTCLSHHLLNSENPAQINEYST